MSLSAGDRLGPYEILSLIGAGGMGEVWKARDTRLNRMVAIKRMKSQYGSRFEQEARAIAALNHANICQIYDVDTSPDGSGHLIMEYIEGQPLAGPLSVDQVTKLALQIIGAIEEAHANGILHRDLKPGNILVTSKGSAKLLDFGLAKLKRTSSDSDATTTLDGGIEGTPAYMAPEQAAGKPVDARSDIFSFGAVLYEMLAGRRAFGGSSTAQVLSAVLRDDPPPLEGPVNLLRVVDKCLAKQPEARFSTASDVRLALEAEASRQASDQPKARPSIAVLPFANMSADKDNEYFSDGLAEEILNLLAKIPGLKVIARTSSFSFRGKEQDIRRIAEALSVGHILEGSVRRAGNRLRITAQLIQATEGAHLWSERYDRDMTDVFAIQDEIAAAISEALEVRLAPRAQAVHTEAYQWYLKGQYHRAHFTPESLAKAKECFEHALAIDPKYAVAHAGLANYEYTLAGVGLKSWAEVAQPARAAAQRALALDPANSEAHSVLGVLAGFVDHDWSLSESHFHKALTVEPVTPPTRFRYAHYFLNSVGRFEEAMEQHRLALDADPLSAPLNWTLAWCLYLAQRHQETMDQSRATLEIDANSYFAWLTLGSAQMSLGLAREAVDSLERCAELAPWYGIGRSYLAAAYHQAGDRERARNCAAAIEEPELFVYFAATGEVDAMFDAMDAYYRRNFFWLTAPFFEPYRSHARFQALLRKTNLAQPRGAAF